MRMRKVGRMAGVFAVLAVLALPWAAVPARAATLEGVTFPDTYQAGGQTLRLNGMALRTVTLLRVRAYVVGLYLAQPSSDAAGILASRSPKVVLMQYLHEADKERIDAEYREGEHNNCSDGSCPREDEADFERLIAAAPAVKVGDTTTFVITSQNLSVLANNRSIGTFVPDLGRLMLAGFIGAHPPSASIKAGLLGAR